MRRVLVEPTEPTYIDGNLVDQYYYIPSQEERTRRDRAAAQQREANIGKPRMTAKAITRNEVGNGIDKVYMSLKAAASDMDVSSSAIGQALKSGGLCRGYEWKYLKKEKEKSFFKL